MNASLRLLPALALACGACASDPAPAADASVTDAPVTDVPVTDVPRDVPSTDVPATDAPRDVPSADAPDADVSNGDVPSSDVPSADVVTSDVSSTDVPPDAPARTATRLAYVLPGDANRPTVWVEGVDGSDRHRVSFEGVTDPVANQAPQVPAVGDGRVLAVHHLAWSPDGGWLAAVVSTAIDQSEVVVLDADRGGGYVASANGAYVMPALDWSPDGRRLAYVMATQPHAGALELATADLPSHTWTLETHGAALRGLSVRVRWSPDATAVLYTRVDGQEAASPWNDRSSVHRMPLGGSEIVLARDLVGTIDALSRDGATQWLTRTTRAGTDGSRDRALVLRSGSPATERTLFEGADLAVFAPDPHGAAGLVGEVDASSASRYRVLRADGTQQRVALPAGADRAAIWSPADAVGTR